MKKQKKKLRKKQKKKLRTAKFTVSLTPKEINEIKEITETPVENIAGGNIVDPKKLSMGRVEAINQTD